MNKDLEKIKVSDIFANINYLVPIYQRNYVWEETQIEQLIEDIESSISDLNKSYFLGNLIVNKRENVYEVIDGQQRLTTLYLLEKYLGIIFEKEALRFEAREKSNRTLSAISNKQELIEEMVSSEILIGFKIIDNYFENKKIVKSEFIKKLEKVFLIRVQVPQGIDLNHYFEIMNTRGEQLELHEIAKAKLLEVLESKHDKNVAALIWEKCSDMDSYVQMNFNMDVRRSIFTDDWGSLNQSVKNFDSIKSKISKESEVSDKENLIDILKKNEIINVSNAKSQDENERFESAISFPNFLLQVNAVIGEIEGHEKEGTSLDDKHLLENLSWAWSSSEDAKKFLFYLLKCRVLFDKYILKREFVKDYKETGRWSLQRLEKYQDKKKNNDKAKYVATLGDDNNNNKRLRTLESCLRITYTSPKAMEWISVVLSELLKNEKTDIIDLLEKYCSKKVKESDYKNSNGFGIERIVFSYLDYLIYRDGYSYEGKEVIGALQDDWQFQFRNSIEHFYPQHPVEVEYWEDSDLNSFGNLALITVSGNSKFSNLLPTYKINSNHGHSIINQSLKLKIMKKLTELDNEEWTQKKASRHKDEMFNILKKNI